MGADFIKFEVEDNVQKALQGLKDDAMLDAITKGMNAGGAMILANVTKERLTGQGPFPVEQHKLGNVTGRLKQAFRFIPATKDGNEVTVAFGDAVVYAAAHEFGFSGEVQVKAHARKEHTIAPHTNRGRQVPKQTRPAKQIGAHTRKMNIPARAPITTGIKEHLGEISEAIAEAITEMLGGAS